MPIAHYSELEAFQLAHDFKIEVYRLVNSCGQPVDFKYRGQVFDAASGIESNIAEGFTRKVPGESAQFYRYALAGLAESCTRLQDGIDRAYLASDDCVVAFRSGRRCTDVTGGLKKSADRHRLRLQAERRRSKAKRPANGKRTSGPNDQR
jgi:four helix bundle protein